MKLKYLLYFLLVMGAIVADESVAKALDEQEIDQPVKQNFGYFSVGLGPLPFPLCVFAGGYRMQSDRNGMDLSVQVSSIILVTQLKANLLYHHYFKQSLCSEFYVGGGIGPSLVVFVEKNGGHVCISPEFVFGKQYRNKKDDLRFFQMQVSFPTLSISKYNHVYKHEEVYLPLIVISYGIGF